MRARRSVYYSKNRLSLGKPCAGFGYRLTAAIETRSTIAGGRGYNKFVPVLGGNGTKTAPIGDIFDQPPSQMR